MKLIKKLIFCVAFISCSVYAQFFPYTDITIDVQDENRQFSVDREYYGTTPFYEFTITDNGSAVDLSGWDFALKYGYDKNADVLYTFTGSDYISVTNNKVLVNGTTNYWFEPHNDYYIALEGTYSSGNYKYIFAEGSMNVTYSPASDEDVNNILNGLTFTLLRITDFVAYTNYINSTVRPEDLGTMAYVSTNDYATISITNNIVALEAGTNTWNSAVQPDDLGSAAYSNATDFATSAEGDLAVTALQTNDVGSAAFSNATDFATAAQGILANTALQTNDVGSAAFASTNDFATAAQGTLSDTALQTNDVGSAAFAETNDFVSSSADNLTAWNTTDGGVLVENTPYQAIGNVAAFDIPSGEAKLYDDFNDSLFGNSVGADGPTDVGTCRFEAFKFGTGIAMQDPDRTIGPTYSMDSFGINNQDDNFTIYAWACKIQNGRTYGYDIFQLRDGSGNLILGAGYNYYGNVRIFSDYAATVEVASPLANGQTGFFEVRYYDKAAYLYVDGVLIANTLPLGDWTLGEGTILIGRNNGGNYYGTLKIDDFVLLKGAAIPGSTSSVPTEQYTPSTTPLLTTIEVSVSNLVEAVNLATTALQTNDVGSAAFAETNDFAAASLTNNVSALESGTNTWNSAVQPGDSITNLTGYGSAALAETSDFATAAEGDLAVSAIQPGAADLAYASRNGSTPMTGDLDMDGYDIVDAGIVSADRFKTTKSQYLYTEVMSLTPETDSKIGYIGSHDYVGSDGGVGFYAVSSSDTNHFELGYLSTNNYINIKSPVISATSNVIEKVTGFGTCTSNNYPVAGLLVGDRYITFVKTEPLSRTNAVDYSRFGAVIAEMKPTFVYESQVNMNITIMYYTAGGYRRNDIVNVFAFWSADLTSMSGFVDTTMLRSDYGTGRNIKLMNKENKLILFNGYFHNSINPYALRRGSTNVSSINTQARGSVTTN